MIDRLHGWVIRLLPNNKDRMLLFEDNSHSREMLKIQDSRFYHTILDLLENLDQTDFGKSIELESHPVVWLFINRLACGFVDRITEEQTLMIMQILICVYGKEVGKIFDFIEEELKNWTGINQDLWRFIKRFYNRLEELGNELDQPTEEVVEKIEAVTREALEDYCGEEVDYFYYSQLVDGDIIARTGYNPSWESEDDQELDKGDELTGDRAVVAKYIEIPEQLNLPFMEIRDGVRVPLFEKIFVKNPVYQVGSGDDECEEKTWL